MVKKYDADSMICASGHGTDSCTGDSGGPLLLQSKSMADPVLIGIVSFGYPIMCSKRISVGVHTCFRRKELDRKQ